MISFILFHDLSQTIFLKICVLIHLFLVALGLVAARGLSLVAASGLLTAVPSLIVASLDEQGLQAHGLQ